MREESVLVYVRIKETTHANASTMSENHHVLPNVRVLNPSLGAEDVRVSPNCLIVLHRPRGDRDLSLFFGLEFKGYSEYN